MHVVHFIKMNTKTIMTRIEVAIYQYSEECQAGLLSNSNRKKRETVWSFTRSFMKIPVKYNTVSYDLFYN